MNITVQSSRTIKPDYGGGGGGAPSTAASVIPLTVLDKVNFDQHISDIFFFHPPAPPSAVLEAGLARALASYREWAGQLGVDADGNRAILLNDAGARFVEATADVALASVGPIHPTPALLGLHPSGAGADELMLVQVTRFACGSFVVGTTGHHLVSDGRAARGFIVAWGEAARGVLAPANEVDDPARHDRVRVFAPRDPPRVEFEHRGAEFKRPDEKRANGTAHHGDDVVVVRKVHFTRDMVAELKSRASEPTAPRPFSTFQCMAAHLWRCVTKSRGLDGATPTTLKIAVDGRLRLRDPPVPAGYTGNVVLWARPTTTADDLLSHPLRDAADLISRAVARVDDGYFRSFVDFASSGAVEAEALVPTADPAETVHCPDVEVYSQVGIPLYDLDFGTGRPFMYAPSYLPEEGLVFLVPGCDGEGSVDVQVGLFRRDMEVFMDCCYSF